MNMALAVNMGNPSASMLRHRASRREEIPAFGADGRNSSAGGASRAVVNRRPEGGADRRVCG
jgi:hypothetical protein